MIWENCLTKALLVSGDVHWSLIPTCYLAPLRVEVRFEACPALVILVVDALTRLVTPLGQSHAERGLEHEGLEICKRFVTTRLAPTIVKTVAKSCWKWFHHEFSLRRTPRVNGPICIRIASWKAFLDIPTKDAKYV